jgi:hypothetical protein
MAEKIAKNAQIAVGRARPSINKGIQTDIITGFPMRHRPLH